MSERIDKIVEGIAGLDPDKDYTSGGLPRVESLEAIKGLAEITGEERGNAWEIHQAKSEAPEDPGTPPEDGSEGETLKDGETPPEESAENPKDEVPEQKVPAAKSKAKVKPPEVKKPKAPFTIAEGKALCSLKGVDGIKGEGFPVNADHFSGGEETLKDLVEKGYIDDNGS